MSADHESRFLMDICCLVL